tara:strand:- start:54 stop:287 length:234 start_codon:yes stop_codon:yes gene_type:complete
MIIVGVLLLFIVMVMVNKGIKEAYVSAPRARAARVDARTYSGVGDAVRGPVEPARKPVKRARRRAVVWYNPVTWRLW